FHLITVGVGAGVFQPPRTLGVVVHPCRDGAVVRRAVPDDVILALGDLFVGEGDLVDLVRVGVITGGGGVEVVADLSARWRERIGHAISRRPGAYGRVLRTERYEFVREEL